METFYEIDADDVITACGGDWDSFACANEGADAQAESVRGYLIWDFILGHDLASFYNALFFSTRMKGAKLVLNYRCDSPEETRLFAMEVLPLGHDALRVTHRLLSTSSAQGVIDLDAVRRGSRCGICARVETDKGWIDPLAVPKVMDIPKGTRVCPDCKATARNAIAAMDVATAVPMEALRNPRHW